MRRTLVMLLAWPLFVAAHHPARGFTGTWVADLDTQAGLSKDVYLVAGGTYSCASCTPPRRYPADGRPHAIDGDPDVTSESVTIAGPRTIVTHIVGPARTRSTTMEVAPDGRTATYVSIDHRPGVRQALKTVYLARRVAPAAPGAHPVSGTWQGIRYVSVPELIRTTELKDDGRDFTYSVPIGARYTARFGGGFVPVRDPHRRMTAAVRREGPRRIVETRMEDGKVIMVRTFTLSPDGKTLSTSSANPETHAAFSISSHRR